MRVATSFAALAGAAIAAALMTPPASAEALSIGGLYRQGAPYPSATRCSGGYRLIHIVPSRGMIRGGGTLVRCRR